MSFTPFNPFTPPPRKPQGPARPTAGVRKPVDPKDAKAEAKAKRNQALRFMFHPEFGQSFSSLQQTHLMFLSLIANLFLQTGLIDATYPGLRDQKQLKLLTLVTTAYRGLEFTREGMPRVMLFGAFTGSVAAMVLSLVLFVVTIAIPEKPQPLPEPLVEYIKNQTAK